MHSCSNCRLAQKLNRSCAQFENEWLHHRINPTNGDVRIFTAEADESPRPWSGINSWMQVMCQGVDHTMPPTGWFGLPSGVVVPEANNGLLNAFQYSVK